MGDKKTSGKLRNRTPISCASCRRKKIRCDRQVPCGPCLARGEADTCHFEGGLPSESNMYLRNRIMELEDQIAFLRKQQARSSSSSGSPFTGAGSSSNDAALDREVQEATASFSMLKVKNLHETKFFGPTSWARVFSPFISRDLDLRSVHSQLKNDLSLIKKTRVPKRHTYVPFSCMEGAGDLNDILKWVPPRVISDILLYRYKKHVDALFHIAHWPTMDASYEQIWTDQVAAVTLSWWALYFALLAVAVHTYSDTEEGFELIKSAFPGHDNVGSLFHTLLCRTEKCLVSAQFMQKGSPYALVALLMLSLVVDGDTYQWALMGFVIQLSKLMGKHRDPSMFADKLGVKGLELSR